MEFGFARTWPRSTSSRSIPRRRQPTLSPGSPWSRSFLNISTPVTTVFRVSRMPTISTSSPTFTTPRSIRPVTTVPLPLIPHTSSIGMRYGFSPHPPGGAVLTEELPQLHLHQLQELLVVHHVLLVQVDHDGRHFHLARQEDVL